MATLSQKLKLLRGLFTGDIAYNAPFYVTIDITSRCNLRCLGCPYHSPLIRKQADVDMANRDISYSVFEALCYDLKMMGTNQIIICGEGEPFLHPHLFDLISAAKKIGLQIILYTNGTFLDDVNIIHLIESRVDVLKVSLWASSNDEYKKNYPVDNTVNLEKVIDGLKLLAHSKATKKSKFPFVNVCHPINAYNFKNIDEMIDLVFRTGCDAISFTPLHTHKGKFSDFSLSVSDEKSLILSLTKAKKRLDSSSVGHNFKQILLRFKIGEAVWEKLPCYIGWLHASVKMNGTVFPCCRHIVPMGNLNEKNFYEIWNDAPFRSFRQASRTREGLASISQNSYCGFCGYVGDNVLVHRLFKWFSPFRSTKIKENLCSEV